MSKNSRNSDWECKKEISHRRENSKKLRLGVHLKGYLHSILTPIRDKFILIPTILLSQFYLKKWLTEVLELACPVPYPLQVMIDVRHLL